MVNPRQRKKHASSKGVSVASRRTKKKLHANRMGRVNVTKHWDKDKNLAQNFKDLGLCIDPNANSLESRSSVVKRRIKIAEQVAENLENPQAIIEEDARAPEKPPVTALVTELEELAATSKPYEAFSARGESLFVQKLISKHGEDYEEMSRDHELNVYQHSAGQLRQRVRKYLKTIEKFSKEAMEES